LIQQNDGGKPAEEQVSLVVFQGQKAGITGETEIGTPGLEAKERKERRDQEWPAPGHVMLRH